MDRDNVVNQVGPFDVIMGRGAPITDNPGNAFMRQLVRERHEQYARAKKQKHKHEIAVSIVKDINARGGRFLRKINASRDRDEAEQQRQLQQESTNANSAQLPSFLSSPEGWVVVSDDSEIVAKVKQLLRDMGPEAMTRRIERRKYRYRKLGEQKLTAQATAIDQQEVPVKAKGNGHETSTEPTAMEDAKEATRESGKSEPHEVFAKDSTETAKNAPLRGSMPTATADTTVLHRPASSFLSATRPQLASGQSATLNIANTLDDRLRFQLMQQQRQALSFPFPPSPFVDPSVSLNSYHSQQQALLQQAQLQQQQQPNLAFLRQHLALTNVPSMGTMPPLFNLQLPSASLSPGYNPSLLPGDFSVLLGQPQPPQNAIALTSRVTQQPSTFPVGRQHGVVDVGTQMWNERQLTAALLGSSQGPSRLLGLQQFPQQQPDLSSPEPSQRQGQSGSSPLVTTRNEPKK